MSTTENRNPKSENIDILPTEEILRLMNEEDAKVIDAVRSAVPFIAKAVDEAVSLIRKGGRIFYVGAGTSGRLGVLDASEMPPTFSVPDDLFRAIIAGGDEAIRHSIEGAEDDADSGRSAASAVTDKDMAIGITASGRTPFVLSFMEEAKRKGARCWLLTCSDIVMTGERKGRAEECRGGITPPLRDIDGVIKIITGPEVIAGSTRLKAGTATKLALNMFSTAVMIKLGRVYKGLMVDVAPTNKKLIGRAEGIIMEMTGCGREEAARYLQISGMKPKTAIVMKAKGVSEEEAERLLRDAEGSLRDILG